MTPLFKCFFYLRWLLSTCAVSTHCQYYHGLGKSLSSVCHSERPKSILSSLVLFSHCLITYCDSSLCYVIRHTAWYNLSESVNFTQINASGMCSWLYCLFIKWWVSNKSISVTHILVSNAGLKITPQWFPVIEYCHWSSMYLEMFTCSEILNICFTICSFHGKMITSQC